VVINYKILNNGCSFSVDREGIKTNKEWESYCKFLPGQVYNIAKSGSGIECDRLIKWLNEQKQPLTHFIYQVPSPTRQLIWSELNDEQFLKAPITVGGKDRKRFFPKKDDSQEHMDWLAGVKLKTLLEHKQDTKIFEHKTRYLKKALLELEKTTTLIREHYPNIKIIFLRYEEDIRPLIHEFHKHWFKHDLLNFCNNNNITYIYENNFRVSWFWKNKLTADKRHPNIEGAKLIAEKIAMYL